jgi:hypothetical protein
MATVDLADDPETSPETGPEGGELGPEYTSVTAPERFLREIDHAGRLVNPPIFPVHEWGDAPIPRRWCPRLR